MVKRYDVTIDIPSNIKNVGKYIEKRIKCNVVMYELIVDFGVENKEGKKNEPK